MDAHFLHTRLSGLVLVTIADREAVAMRGELHDRAMRPHCCTGGVIKTPQAAPNGE